MSFEEKVALITGGGAGIGRATAIAFGESGAKVMITDIDATAAEETARLVEQAGGEASGMGSGASTSADVEAAVTATVDTFGSLHFAVNNVAGNLEYRLLHEIDEEGWDQDIDRMLKSIWLSMKYEIPAIKRSGGGAIVNVASAAVIKSSPGLSTFGAAKAGVVSLSKSAAAELARDNIRVNCISPGGVMTASLERLWKTEPDLKEPLESAHALGRLAKPEEIARCIRFLCSDDASFMTGDNVVVDGGAGVVPKI